MIHSVSLVQKSVNIRYCLKTKRRKLMSLVFIQALNSASEQRDTLQQIQLLIQPLLFCLLLSGTESCKPLGTAVPGSHHGHTSDKARNMYLKLTWSVDVDSKKGVRYCLYFPPMLPHCASLEINITICKMISKILLHTFPLPCNVQNLS